MRSTKKLVTSAVLIATNVFAIVALVLASVRIGHKGATGDRGSQGERGYRGEPGAFADHVHQFPVEHAAASASDNAVARFHGSSGTQMQSSLARLDDAGVLSTPAAQFNSYVQTGATQDSTAMLERKHHQVYNTASGFGIAASVMINSYITVTGLTSTATFTFPTAPTLSAEYPFSNVVNATFSMLVVNLSAFNLSLVEGAGGVQPVGSCIVPASNTGLLTFQSLTVGSWLVYCSSATR